MHAADLALLRAARTTAHTPQRDRAVAAFSALGQHAAIWLAFGAGAATFSERGQRRAWRVATATVAGSYVFNTALKFAVRRPRPQLRDLPPLTSTPTQLSFPSAHATTSFAAARVYSAAGAPALPLYVLAGGLAASRLYLGVHYPSDILAGAVLGTVIGSLPTRPQPAVAGSAESPSGPRISP